GCVWPDAAAAIASAIAHDTSTRIALDPICKQCSPDERGRPRRIRRRAEVADRRGRLRDRLFLREVSEDKVGRVDLREDLVVRSKRRAQLDAAADVAPL